MATATLRPDSGISKSPLGTQTLPASPNAGSFSPGPSSGYASPASSSTAATSAAPSTLPSNEEVEARIKQATSTAPTSDGRLPPGKDTRTQLFAGNLPYRVRWQDLKDLFRRSGTVLRADVSLTPDNRSRGYGTVLLASAEDAGRAVDMFNGYSWQGRILEVRLDRLGANPGADLDPRTGAIVPGLLPIAVNGTGLNPNVGGIGPGSVNGLHVPSPHPALPFPAGTAQNLRASPIPSAAVASPLTNGTLSGALSNGSMSADLIALQQQQAHLERNGEELLMNQIGGSGRGGLDSSFGMLGRGFSVDLEKERARSNQGMRSLFIGNLPFHCQWQDLKDLFRQAGTILRADVSLGPDGRSRGFGTVSYANDIDAERAVAKFNGFDYNGRILKVHYDKFSAQSPLPSTLSSDTTPVQAVNMSTQAAILQAAQLQQLVSNQTYGHYNVFDGDVTDRSWRNNGNNSIAGGVFAQAYAQTLDSSLQALHDSLQMHSPTRHMTTPSKGQQGAQTTTSSSETSPSPFSYQLLGTSPSLAERRQKVPPPIGSRPTTSSGTGFGSGVAEERRSSNGSLPLTNLISNPFSTTTASPTRSIRPAGQSLPVSSASVPTTSSSEDSSVSKRSATTSSVPTLGSSDTSGSTSNGTSTLTSSSNHSSQSPAATACASPRSSHPAHPGPISLPPPPPVSSFPLYSPHHHPMSPQGHPMSPPGPVYSGYSYGPMSPMHSYPLPPHMHPHNMTPHGLPPITPSMPSFSFVPQPSPAVPAGGSSAIPPTPAEGGPQPPEGYGASGPAGDSAGSQMSMMSMMSPPLHLPHHVFQPFTPGAAMSPGAFYGRPNGGQPHGSAWPHLNPAVGSPVLIHPPYGFPHPSSQPGSPYYQPQFNGGPYGEEPGGYFPLVNAGPPPPRHEGYFPPLSALGSSGLANEILKDGSSMNMDGYGGDDRPAHERNDSGSAPESSENGPGEDTDAERARSSSSGATSWHSSDENAAGVRDAGAGRNSSLEELANDMASVQLGSRPKGCSTKREETSYAAAAAAPDNKRSVQRKESPDDVAGQSLAARRSSMSSESTRRPAAPQKTHSDETGTHVRLNAEDSTVS